MENMWWLLAGGLMLIGLGYGVLRLFKPIAEDIDVPLSLPKESHFIFGHAKYLDKDFIKNFGKICLEGADQFGLSSFYLFNRRTICVTSAEHVKAVMQGSSHRERVPIISKHFDMALGKKSLTQLMGTEWVFHRKLMSKAFHWEHLQTMVSDMNTMAAKFVEILLDKTGTIVDLAKAAKSVTLDVIGLTAFGYDFKSVENSFEESPIANAFDFMLAEITRRQFEDTLNPKSYFYSYPSEENIKFNKSRDLIHQTLQCIISSRQEEVASGNLKHHDLLRYLLQSYKEDHLTLDREALLDNLITLMFAGYDTSSITLCYLMYSLAKYPDVEARALQEINTIVKPGALPTYEQLSKDFVYCTAVIEEVLRLYPPAPLTVRNLLEPITLSRSKVARKGDTSEKENISPVVLPAGATVYIPIWWIHRSELNFKNPLNFDPERFLPENRSEIHRYASIPFSGGARDCIGRRFAMLELLSIFIAVIREVRFECVPEYVLEPIKVGVVQSPKGGMPLRVFKRMG